MTSEHLAPREIRTPPPRFRGDPALLAQVAAAAGDVAFERTLAPLLHPGFELAFAVLRDRHAAEDAVQEAAVSAWRSFGQLREEERARAWFLKIVLNRCRATMRMRWWRSPVLTERTGGCVPPPDDGVALRLDLERALRRLSRDQRAVLFLHFQMDLPQEEIARILGVRLGTVKSRVHRAVACLREAREELR
jgi:RNA polymerase sigma-70 factor (ECF subfamily)